MFDFVRLCEGSNALFVDACLRHSKNCPGSHCRYSLWINCAALRSSSCAKYSICESLCS